MRLKCFLAMMLVVFGCGILVAAEPVLFDLDGREAVVRVYRSEAQRRANKYETETVVIAGRSIEVEVKDANYSTILKLAGEDQKDEVVKKYLGRNGRGFNYEGESKFYLPMMEAELDGREVVARIYKNGERDVSAYKSMSSVISKRKIKPDVEDMEGELVVVIFGEDQRDPVVRDALGTTVQGWNYVKGFEPYMPSKEQSHKESYRWVFYNAIGNIVPDVSADLYLDNGEDSRVFLGRYEGNEKGEILLPYCIGGMKEYGDARSCRYEIRAHCAIYGTSIFLSFAKRREGELYIPRVPVGSEADERSIWGKVVDPNGNAVSGAVLWGGSVMPAGAKYVGNVASQREGVVTDEYGRFRMYVPIAGDAEQIGTLIPPNSQYSIRIEPPESSKLLLYKGKIPNGRSTMVQLESPGCFHTFEFVDEDGVITDLKKLRDIELRFEIKGGSDKYLGQYDEWKDGCRLVSGVYIAGSYQCSFEPLEVTSESPEKLVFRLKPARTYCGRVVDGITGAPVSGARVRVSRKGSDMTGDDGRFEVTTAAGELVWLVAVSKDGYLKVHIRKNPTKRDKQGRYLVPEVKLFPSSTVSVELIHETGARRWPLHFRPQWFVVGQNPSWVKDFEALCVGSPYDGIFRDFELEANKRGSFSIPEGVNLRIHVRGLGNIEWGPVTICDNVRLKQGQEFDAGKVVIGDLFAVFVAVSNSRGEPVEGIPVTVCGNWDPVISSSDENGIALIEFAGPSSGDFIVEHKPDDASLPVLRETIPYVINGVEDANSVYEFQVSDELIRQILK